MKIIQKGKMPNGVEVQLEDWSEHNSPEYPNLYGLTIGAYPTAVHSGKYGFIRAGASFRLSLIAETDAEVSAMYDQLIKGEATLADFEKHFYHGDKDRWYLGLFAPETDEWYKAKELYGI